MPKEKPLPAYTNESDLNEAVINFRRYLDVLRKWDALAGLASVYLLVLGLALMLFTTGVIPVGELQGVDT